MGRPIVIEIELQDGVIFTGGSKLVATAKIGVHKTEAQLGDAFVTLICEERGGTSCKASIVHTAALTSWPETFIRGSYTMPIEFVIPESVSQFPSLMVTSDPREKVGVYWILRLRFTNTTSTTADAIVPMFPSRDLGTNIWDAQLSRDSASLSTTSETEGSETVAYTPRSPRAREASHAAPQGRTLNSGNNNQRNEETQSIDSELLETDENRRRECGNRTQHRMQRDVRGFREVVYRGSVIVSKKDDARPLKGVNRVFIALFGERYRHPEQGELEEAHVRSKLLVPKAGVFQTPQKAGLRLKVWTARENTIMLSSVFVKLLIETRVIQTNESYTTTEEIFKRDPELPLESGLSDITEELADLEIPTSCESTDTEYLQRRYAVRVTLVFRAVNLSNISRWHTMQSPLHVLPSIVQIAADQHAALPPPYQG